MRSRTLALTIATAAGSGVAIALARLKRPDAARRRSSPQPETYRCACGQGFRVAGSGRHRVFWLDEAPARDPLLGSECPNCGRSLV
jgi:hypothetical protein